MSEDKDEEIEEISSHFISFIHDKGSQARELCRELKKLLKKRTKKLRRKKRCTQ